MTTFDIPSYIPCRDSLNDIEQKIPKKIFQTWKTNSVSKEMYDSIQTIINLNPEYEYHFFNNVDCRNFIEINFDKNILKAYDKIIPGAYKADLWRYCVLYIHGGIYLDCKTILLEPLRTIIRPDINGLICIDRPDNYLLNGIMMFESKNQYVLNLINKATNNILDGIYAREDWLVLTKYGYHGAYAITGPYLCGKEFKKYVATDKIEPIEYSIGNEKYDLTMIFKKGTNFDIVHDNKVVMKKCYNGYYQRSGRDSYGKMFAERKIFNI